MEITIIPFEERYRDDMIFMVLQAKDALGRVPRLNDDLLSIKQSYMDKDAMFWLALDEDKRVVGTIGYSNIEHSTEVWIHRLYVKAKLKRRGIGSKLLETAEAWIKEEGKTAIRVHLGDEQYFEAYSFYPKHGYKDFGPRLMRKEL